MVAVPFFLSDINNNIRSLKTCDVRIGLTEFFHIHISRNTMFLHLEKSFIYLDFIQFLLYRFELPQLSQLPLGQMGYPQAQEWVRQRQANIRPWSLFLNTNNIRAPPSLSRFTKRVMKNIEYFQSNYLFVFLGLVIYCL